MEEELYRQFHERHGKGLKVKSWLFEAKSKELMRQMHPDVAFIAFKLRNKVSYCSTTNISQKTPSNYEIQIRGFHQHLRRLAKRGKSKGETGQYELRDIGNIDQTPLPFSFDKGKGYDDTGTSTVWYRGCASRPREVTVHCSAYHVFRWKATCEASFDLPGEGLTNC